MLSTCTQIVNLVNLYLTYVSVLYILKILCIYILRSCTSWRLYNSCTSVSLALCAYIKSCKSFTSVSWTTAHLVDHVNLAHAYLEDFYILEIFYIAILSTCIYISSKPCRSLSWSLVELVDLLDLTKVYLDVDLVNLLHRYHAHLMEQQ